jgi:hypothetical protein
MFQEILQEMEEEKNMHKNKQFCPWTGRCTKHPPPPFKRTANGAPPWQKYYFAHRLQPNVLDNTLLLRGWVEV